MRLRHSDIAGGEPKGGFRMNIFLQSPPELSGSAAEDVAALNRWCRALHTELRRVLYSLDGENIISVPYEKITGIPECEGSESE